MKQDGNTKTYSHISIPYNPYLKTPKHLKNQKIKQVLLNQLTECLYTHQQDYKF